MKDQNYKDGNMTNALACTFVSMDDAETVFNILINRGYSSEEISILVSGSIIKSCEESNKSLFNIFQNAPVLDDGILVSGIFKSDLNTTGLSIEKCLEELSISKANSEIYVKSLMENEVILVVKPHDETDKKMLNEEFSFYKGKQINGSEAYTV